MQSTAPLISPHFKSIFIIFFFVIILFCLSPPPPLTQHVNADVLLPSHRLHLHFINGRGCCCYCYCTELTFVFYSFSRLCLHSTLCVSERAMSELMTVVRRAMVLSKKPAAALVLRFTLSMHHRQLID